MPNRDYLYYDLTSSVCSTCLRKVEAKIIIQDERVYMVKHCMLHGREKVLISTDVSYYKQCREFIKPSEMPYRWNTPIKYGCPYDCGLCPDHEQHSCLSIIEITDVCNLQCPICYAESSPKRTTWRTVEHVEMMLDAVVKNEKNPDVVQISGGEPTLHPHFFDILNIAKQKPIKHIMINTNGLRIAQDITFVEKLVKYTPGFEIYLQFDSLEKEALQSLRGADLREIRRRAIENLNKYNISTTLVVTLKKGVNDKEIGEILQYAIQQKCVRGVTFQPIQQAGRTEDFNPETNRLTLSEVRQMIIEQSSLFTEDDIIPVPCHPDSLAMAYALKLDGSIFPLTSIIDRNILLEGERNTIVFESDEQLKGQIFKLFSLNHSPESGYDSLKELLCCLPKVSLPTGIGYENVFRVLIMKFMDNYDLDIRSVKKSCVHIVHPDGRIIPFDTYNLFYRDEKEEYLKELQGEGGIIK